MSVSNIGMSSEMPIPPSAEKVSYDANAGVFTLPNGKKYLVTEFDGESFGPQKKLSPEQAQRLLQIFQNTFSTAEATKALEGRSGFELNIDHTNKKTYIKGPEDTGLGKEITIKNPSYYKEMAALFKKSAKIATKDSSEDSKAKRASSSSVERPPDLNAERMQRQLLEKTQSKPSEGDALKKSLDDTTSLGTRIEKRLAKLSGKKGSEKNLKELEKMYQEFSKRLGSLTDAMPLETRTPSEKVAIRDLLDADKRILRNMRELSDESLKLNSNEKNVRDAFLKGKLLSSSHRPEENTKYAKSLMGSMSKLMARANMMGHEKSQEHLKNLINELNKPENEYMVKEISTQAILTDFFSELQSYCRAHNLKLPIKAFT